MILYIDSSEKEKFILGLYDNKNKPIFKSIKSPIGTMSEKFLKELDKFLKSNKLRLKNFTAIIVFQGPGSYTSLRIGISIANVLAWSLNIPIIGMLVKNLKCKAQNSNLKLKTGENIILKDIQSIIKKMRNKKDFNKPVKPFYQQVIA